MLTLLTLVLSVLACTFARELHAVPRYRGKPVPKYYAPPFSASIAATTNQSAFAVKPGTATVSAQTSGQVGGGNGAVSGGAGFSVDATSTAKPGQGFIFLPGVGVVDQQTSGSSFVNQNGSSSGFSTTQAATATGNGGSAAVSTQNSAGSSFQTKNSGSGAVVSVTASASGGSVYQATSGQTSTTG